MGGVAGECDRAPGRVVDADELLLKSVEDKLWLNIGDCDGIDGRRGDVARGVADGVWTSASTDDSCGVMGLGIPGI